MRTKPQLVALLVSVPLCTFGNESPTIRIVSHIPRAQVQSTALRTVGYSQKRHILEVEFLNGAIYRYYQVGPAAYRDLINAPSKARYYDFNIRHKYVSARVKPRLPPHD